MEIHAEPDPLPWLDYPVTIIIITVCLCPKVSKSRAKKASGLTTRAGKGRGRRTLMKRKPVKSVKNPPTAVTAEKVYYKVIIKWINNLNNAF